MNVVRIPRKTNSLMYSLGSEINNNTYTVLVNQVYKYIVEAMSNWLK